MAVISVTTSATELADGKKAGVVGATWAVIQNRGAADLYVDDVNTVTADDTATGGVKVPAGDTLSMPVSGSSKLYGIVASGTLNVAVNDAATP